MKKHWVNPNCQSSEPTKRTVSISANGFFEMHKPDKSENTFGIRYQLSKHLTLTNTFWGI